MKKENIKILRNSYSNLELILFPISLALPTEIMSKVGDSWYISGDFCINAESSRKAARELIEDPNIPIERWFISFNRDLRDYDADPNKYRTYKSITPKTIKDCLSSWEFYTNIVKCSCSDDRIVKTLLGGSNSAIESVDISYEPSEVFCGSYSEPYEIFVVEQFRLLNKGNL